MRFETLVRFLLGVVIGLVGSRVVHLAYDALAQ